MSKTTEAAAIIFPSTLTDPPVKSLVSPGECQFGDDFTPVPLLAKFSISPTSYVLRFGLPDESKALGLSTCACILAGIKIGDEMVVRPYTPISTNAMIGSFDLLIKSYAEGKASSAMTSLTPSPDETSVSFKHIAFNVKIQHPYGNPKFVGMIAGGTGISPMLQALHAILGEDDQSLKASTNVSLLYGSRTSDDILGKEMLDVWSGSHKEQFCVTHVLSNEEEDTVIEDCMERGFIHREMIEKAFPSPSDDVKIFVCGPPVMYDILCGPRNQKEISGILGQIGYDETQVVKF